jgi:hypothetical protein
MPETKSESKLTDLKKKRRQRVGRLKTASDVRIFVSRMLKRIARGEGVSDAYKAVIGAGVLLKAVELTDLQDRIEKLEEKKETQ